MNDSNNQLYFPFNKNLTYQTEDFIVTESNKISYQFIMKWPHWGDERLSNVTYLMGAKNSGKTHMAHIWQKLSNAHFLSQDDFLKQKFVKIIDLNKSFILENIEDFLEFENDLFHAFNLIVEQKKFLLITSYLSPIENKIHLKDLKSRIIGCNQVEIQEPEDLLIEGILLKLLSDRDLRLKKEVLGFILNNTDRSYSAITNFINFIDQKSLEHKKNITIPFLKKYNKI